MPDVTSPAVQVRFAHPWTDPYTGTGYAPGQTASFDEDLAKRLVYNGVAAYLDGSSQPLVDPGVIDDVELGQVLAGYEKKVPRAGANPGYVVTLDSENNLVLSPAGVSGGDGQVVSGATPTQQGLVRLAGDLAGTADEPTVPGLAQRLTLEEVQDAVGNMLVGSGTVQVTYDDATGVVTILGSGGAGGATDPEVVRDVIGVALRAGAGINVAVDDAQNTITISATGGGTGGGGVADAEAVQDIVGAMLFGGTGIEVTYDDALGRVTVTATGGGTGGGATDVEVVRDTIAAALRNGSGVTITADDAANTITIGMANATAAAPGAVQLAGDLEGSATAPTVKGLSGKYDFPAGGIPSGHMTAAVRESLAKADTAIPGSQKGAPGGLATLGSDGRLTAAQMPVGAGAVYLGHPAMPVTDPAAARPTLAAGVSCWWRTTRQPDNWIDDDVQMESS